MITPVEAQHTPSSLKRKNALDQRCGTKLVRIRCFLKSRTGHIEWWGGFGALLSPFHSRGISRTCGSWLLGLPNPQRLQSFLAGRGLEPTSPLQPGVGVALPRAVTTLQHPPQAWNCHSSAVRTSAWVSQPLLPLHGRKQSKLNLSDPISGKKKKNLSIYQEKKLQEIKIWWCIEALSFIKTNAKEVSGEPETQRFVPRLSVKGSIILVMPRLWV